MIAYYLGFTNTVYTIIIAPLMEEIFFRGFVLGTPFGRNKDYRLWTPGRFFHLLFSSLLFALAHIFKHSTVFSFDTLVFVLVYYGANGIPLGFVYLWTKTILWCFIVHIVFNISTLLGASKYIFYTLVGISIVIVIAYGIKIVKTRENPSVHVD